MKSTGVVRKVDELGRIVLPIEIRKVLDINVKDAVEIFTDEDKIVLRKYFPACVFCGNADNIVYFNKSVFALIALRKSRSSFKRFVKSVKLKGACLVMVFTVPQALFVF